MTSWSASQSTISSASYVPIPRATVAPFWCSTRVGIHWAASCAVTSGQVSTSARTREKQP